METATTKLLFLDYDGTIIPVPSEFEKIDDTFKTHLESFFDDLLVAARKHGFLVSILTNSGPGWIEHSSKIVAPRVWDKYLKHLRTYHAMELTNREATDLPKFHVISQVAPEMSHILGIGDVEDDRLAVILQDQPAIKKSILLSNPDFSIETLIRLQQHLRVLFDDIMSHPSDMDLVLIPKPVEITYRSVSPSSTEAVCDELI